MPAYDLKSTEGLAAAATELLELRSDESWYREWIAGIAEDIEWARAADEAERASMDFQRRLWDDNRISSVGQGNVRVDGMLEDESFRLWLAMQSLQPMPASRTARSSRQLDIYREMVERARPLCERVPHLKIFRVLAVLFPGDFTAIGFRKQLRRQCFALGAPRGLDPVQRHTFVLDRLDEALGEPGGEPSDIARRISLPWLLFVDAIEKDEDDPAETDASKRGEDRLVPLPAARRRRGITSVKGLFPMILGVLEYARDGVTREELMDHLRGLNPTLKDVSLGAIIHTLQGELAVIRMEGERYILTEQGEAVLETGDASELADWLLTHILGVDAAVAHLRDHQAATTSELVAAIRALHPGWTTDRPATGLLGWLRSFAVVERTDDGRYRLSPEGKEWAARIHWQPEALPADDEDSDEGVVREAPAAPEARPAQRPPLAEIQKHVSAVGHFEPALVAHLHAGLWAHPRRHFAILTGLSGAGKTLLARSYARALQAETKAADKRVCTIAVQPGWYDPGSLLGYVNPLRGESYIRTPFLEFLLAADASPELPFVAILDEMNLSHPEQYMAPLLSAMETGADIPFHAEGELFDGVPASIPYPANLVLIGTVNMDETTHGLSDKVLDRAFTLEFWDIDLDRYPSWGKRSALTPAHEERARAVLSGLMAALRPARLHFGWRVVDDTLDFLAVAAGGDGAASLEGALDQVVYAKIVPKLRGDDRPAFRAALTACAKVLGEHGLGRSRAKVDELAADLDATGSARFWR